MTTSANWSPDNPHDQPPTPNPPQPSVPLPPLPGTDEEN